MKKSKWLIVGTCLTVFLSSCGGEMQEGDNQQDENNDAMVQEQLDDKSHQNNKMEVDMDNISDETLKDFINIDQKLQVIQQQKQSEMLQMVESSDITLEEYQQIATAQQQGQQPEGFTDNQMSTFNSLSEQITEIESDMMSEFETIIIQEGYDMDTYKVLAENISASPELQQQLQNIMMADQPDNDNTNQ